MRRVIARLVLAGITAAVVTQCPERAVGQDTAAAVVATRVVIREVNAGHRVIGTVLPIRRSTIGSALEGRVAEYLVQRGDAVKQGQPLAELRRQTLDIELAAASAELELYSQELAEKVNGSRVEEIEEARARMLAAEAAKENASKKLQRMESLFATNAVNQEDLDDARERATATGQLYLAAKAASSLVEAGPRPEQIARARAQVALQQERVRLIEDRMEKLTIVAPFNGFVTEEHTEVGEWISQGDPVATIIEVSDVEVQANVAAEHVVRLREGQVVPVECPGIPGEIFTGVVTRIVPTANDVTRTYPVNIGVANPLVDGRPTLLAGMLARATLPTGDVTRLPLVPKDALVLNGLQRAVFVVDQVNRELARGRVRLVPVELGAADGELIQLDAPIQADELVVILGNERLRDGQEVTIRESQPVAPSSPQ